MPACCQVQEVVSARNTNTTRAIGVIMMGPASSADDSIALHACRTQRSSPGITASIYTTAREAEPTRHAKSVYRRRLACSRIPAATANRPL